MAERTVLEGGHRLAGDELAAYPLLSKYLNGIKLWPADGERWAGAENWITFPVRGGSFDRETMLKPLREIVAEKISHYAATRTGFDDLSLLIIYNQAWIYNSPAETPFHNFEDLVAELKGMIGDNRGPFDRVLLYIALEPAASSEWADVDVQLFLIRGQGVPARCNGAIIGSGIRCLRQRARAPKPIQLCDAERWTEIQSDLLGTRRAVSKGQGSLF
jgi:hypothetical protein